MASVALRIPWSGRSPSCTVAACAVVLAVVGAGCAHGGSPRERDIVWQGEVEIRGSVVIAAGARLVIQPGTRVVFAFVDKDGDGAGDSGIVVKGSILAQGTPQAPIEFFPEKPGLAGSPGWDGLLVEDASSATFAHCRFFGAGQAVHSHRTRLVVEACRFERNGFAVRFTGGPVLIEASGFFANGTAVRYWESSPRIVGNVFAGNGTAVFVREGSSGTVFRGNDFAASADYHVKLGEAQSVDVDARENWWGGSSSEEIEKMIFDREDADYLGRVRYDPRLPAPGQRDTP